ncbi:MAG: polyprenyl synthetase family protein [Candidatus Omnitrophica bacterium]|nr:polyprenyl synthetase family protein [Candidatus Omnitrophota bacterium]
MELKEVYQPISFELELVKERIKRTLKTEDEKMEEVLSYFFNQEGKFLRPCLVILSAKAVIKNKSPIFEKNLIDLATAVEIIHSASLIHDDVIDEEIERRGQLSLNRKYGNRIAVLTGDFLYTRAFSLLLELPSPIIHLLNEASSKMCLGEIQELNINGNFSSYLEMIENKTAFFISACCQAGGLLAQGQAKEIKNLSDYGLYLGLAYQIYDDSIDGGQLHFENLNLWIENLANQAKNSLKDLSETIFKEKMLKLIDYILLPIKAEKWRGK